MRSHTNQNVTLLTPLLEYILHTFTARLQTCVCSQEWKTVSIEEQKRLGRVRQEDGEFWWVYRNVIPATVTQLLWGPPVAVPAHYRVDTQQGWMKRWQRWLKRHQYFQTEQMRWLQSRNQMCLCFWTWMCQCYSNTLSIYRRRKSVWPVALFLSLSVRMSVSDFRQNFEVMEVCHLTEALGEPGSSMLPLSCIMHHGNWAPNITAGGSPQGGKTGDDVCQMFCASLLTLNRTSPAAGFKTGDKAGIFKTRQKFTSTITTEFKSRGQSGEQLVSCVN